MSCFSYLYHNIIQWLAEASQHGIVIDKLKDNIMLFKPKVEPM